MAIVKEGTTKDGTEYVIRHPEMGDVESAWKYANRLSQERTFINFQGEEITLEDEQKFIEKFICAIEDNSGMLLFVVVDNEVLGVGEVAMKKLADKHVGVLGLSLDVSIRGKGLGRTLLEILLSECERTIERLKIVTLAVKEPNTLAISLYEKLGFMEYGRLPDGNSQDGEFVDEILMYKNVG